MTSSSSNDVQHLAKLIAEGLSLGPSHESNELATVCQQVFAPRCNLLRLQLGVKESLSIITGNLMANAQPWNVSMFEDKRNWKKSIDITPLAGGQDTLKLPMIQSRIVDSSGAIFYRCPIMRGTAVKSTDQPSSSLAQAQPCPSTTEIGAVIIGLPSTGDSHQKLLDLANLALILGTTHAKELDDFASTVSSILFAPTHPMAEDHSRPVEDGPWSDDEGLVFDDGNENGMADRANGDVRLSLSQRDMDPLTLRFTHPQAEKAYSCWVARHMWKFDAFSLCLTLLFKSIIVFCPGTAYGLYYKVPWQSWALGYIHGLPVFLLCKQSTRHWYESHRDMILLAVLLISLFYQQFIVVNYMNLAPVALLRSPLFTFNFTWLPTVALLYQMKFSMQAPVIAAMTAINMTLLKPMCTMCFPDESAEWCCFRVGTKVLAMVASALLIVYCVEWRARRVWLLSR